MNFINFINFMNLFIGVGEQCQISCSFDGLSEVSLVFGAKPRFFSGSDSSPRA
jgi:hypothetical protein